MTIRVLVVDDSAFIRRVLKRILGADAGFEVAASAANGRLALRALEENAVDAVVLDVEMPVMDGIETLKEIRRRDPRLPVVMFSTITTRGGEATLEALAHGASDYVTKPSNHDSADEAFAAVRDQLLPRLRVLVEARAPRRETVATVTASSVPVRPESRPSAPVPSHAGPPSGPVALPAPRARKRSTAIELVAIGVSTGGPSALATLLGGLSADLDVPVVVTQHMPPLFTGLLAQRLDSVSPLTVTEASDGDPLEPGHVYLAPGDFHLKLERNGDRVRVRLDQGAPVNSCRPAVDVMLRSIASVHPDRTLVVILTGMGRDGFEGSRTLADLGSHVLAQDAETSVVWGMPGYVAKGGVADAIVPIGEMAREITRIVRAGSRATAGPARAERTP